MLVENLDDATSLHQDRPLVDDRITITPLHVILWRDVVVRRTLLGEFGADGQLAAVPVGRTALAYDVLPERGRSSAPSRPATPPVTPPTTPPTTTPTGPAASDPASEPSRAPRTTPCALAIIGKATRAAKIVQPIFLFMHSSFVSMFRSRIETFGNVRQNALRWGLAPLSDESSISAAIAAASGIAFLLDESSVVFRCGCARDPEIG